MVTVITRAELAEAIESGSVTVLDTLGPAYYAKAHLPGARILVEADVEALAAQVLPDRDAAIVTYCSNEVCRNSENVAVKLQALGYGNVRAYRAGIADWAAAGLPVESGA
ncbi:rhodanese-like domain-containing protein [Nocardia sp. NPDC050712]|uniref:rhodanese-like domain-containing protein n=1 Tax=Nocardia sp. NPDC050712 TaxID=3155518 RepID=UPI00341003CE